MVKSLIGFCVAIFVCAVFVSTPFPAWAKAPKAPKAAVTTPEQDKKAEDAFDVFKTTWMQQLRQHGQYGVASMKVEEDPDMKGSYIASYTDLSEPKETEVKKTGNKVSPYVGTLKYQKDEYASRGNSPEDAKKGQFKPRGSEMVSEIFRYSKGQWLY